MLKKILEESLSLYLKPFDGKIGKVPDYKFKIKLRPRSTPSFQQQFPIPYKYQDMFKKKLQNMINDEI